VHRPQFSQRTAASAHPQAGPNPSPPTPPTGRIELNGVIGTGTCSYELRFAATLSYYLLFLAAPVDSATVLQMMTPEVERLLSGQSSHVASTNRNKTCLLCWDLHCGCM
jgi:hypothetical protein